MPGVTLLDPEILDRLQPGEPVVRWQRELLAAGLLAEVRLPDAPAAADREIVRLLREAEGGVEGRIAAMHRLEEETAQLAHPIQWMRGSVRPEALLIIAALLYGLPRLWLSAATSLDLTPQIEAMGVPVSLLLVVLPGLAWLVRQEMARRTRWAAAKAARAAAGQEFRETLERILSQTFVLQASSGWIVGAPHRAWLRHRLAELREQRTLPERLEWLEAVGALTVAVEPMDAVLSGLGGSASMTVEEREEAVERLEVVGLEGLVERVRECRVRAGRSGGWVRGWVSPGL